DAIDGVRRVAETFRERGERIDWCITGEPSSQQKLGDLLRVGRRGSLTGHLTVRGIQGHVAYPDEARNPIHQAAPALAELATRQWDDGYEPFPPPASRSATSTPALAPTTSFRVSSGRPSTSATTPAGMQRSWKRKSPRC